MSQLPQVGADSITKAIQPVFPRMWTAFSVQETKLLTGKFQVS